MLRNLFIKLWKDETGVIATEYLMLSSIVAVGSATGLAAMRDSIAEEYKDFGNTVRETRQSYTHPAMHSGLGTAAGSHAVNTPYTNGTTNYQPIQANQYSFSSP